ncbi:LysR family transcriptional regulator [Streptomyces afghaniensis]|uniref:LysR family transcriptional regulator n=1 Tax=Streptomyces afghaniensis TaxID=66865 RepID=UPI0037A04EBA
MDVEALRTFVSVAEAGQFQAAADELGTSQQAVSVPLVGLESTSMSGSWCAPPGGPG